MFSKVRSAPHLLRKRNYFLKLVQNNQLAGKYSIGALKLDYFSAPNDLFGFFVSLLSLSKRTNCGDAVREPFRRRVLCKLTVPELL